MLKRQTVNQPTACVRTAHTLHVGFEVPRNSQVGCVAQPRTWSVGMQATACLLKTNLQRS